MLLDDVCAKNIELFRPHHLLYPNHSWCKDSLRRLNLLSLDFLFLLELFLSIKFRFPLSPHNDLRSSSHLRHFHVSWRELCINISWIFFFRLAREMIDFINLVLDYFWRWQIFRSIIFKINIIFCIWKWHIWKSDRPSLWYIKMDWALIALNFIWDIDRSWRSDEAEFISVSGVLLTHHTLCWSIRHILTLKTSIHTNNAVVIHLLTFRNYISLNSSHISFWSLRQSM